MTMKTTLAALLVLALAGATIAAVYGHTRAKWRDLGRQTGIVEGRAQALEILCALAAPGELHEAPDAALEVKASAATLVRQGHFVEIRCNQAFAPASPGRPPAAAPRR